MLEGLVAEEADPVGPQLWPVAAGPHPVRVVDEDADVPGRRVQLTLVDVPDSHAHQRLFGPPFARARTRIRTSWTAAVNAAAAKSPSPSQIPNRPSTTAPATAPTTSSTQRNVPSSRPVRRPPSRRSPARPRSRGTGSRGRG